MKRINKREGPCSSSPFIPEEPIHARSPLAFSPQEGGKKGGGKRKIREDSTLRRVPH